MTLRAVNPATGETVGQYKETSRAEVNSTITRSHEAFLQWRKTGFAERAGLMDRAARILRDEAGEHARLMAQEMGKPVAGGRQEIEKCAWACEYYAGNAEEFLRPERIDAGATASLVTFQPLGVILAVMPWNFPFWQVFRFAAPALVAGNVVVLKHASNVPGCALAVERIFDMAGFPPGVFSTVLVDSTEVDRIIGDPLIKAVTLTGSTEAGRAVSRKAGDMLKKTVLELGGSDPYVVLEDADIEQAAVACVTSRLINSGQSCIAAKRFIVVDSVRDRFERVVVELMQAQKMGDPLEEDTTVGPLARHDLRDDLHRQVADSIAKGARCLLGGYIPDGRGAFYPPTVLTGVKKGMAAHDEELFGPVAAMVPVKNDEDAIAAANDSEYGLGAAVFTRDAARGEAIAVNEIEAGCCFVNDFVKSDPRLPFGGIKHSGYGRELSHYGIKEFVNIKTVVVK